MEQERDEQVGDSYRISVKVSVGARCESPEDAQISGERFTEVVRDLIGDLVAPMDSGLDLDDVDVDLEVLPLVRVPKGYDSDTVLAMEASREIWAFWWQVPDNLWYVAKEGMSLVYVNTDEGRMVVNGIRPRRFTEDGTELIDSTDRSENIELTSAPSTPEGTLTAAGAIAWIPWTRPVQFVN